METKRNSRRNFKMSNRTKSILIAIGMILLIFAVLAGVYALLNKKDDVPAGFETYDVTWKSGGIDSENGSMKIDKEFMYSSEIKCDTTLKIVRDFSSDVSFRVYYYDELGTLVYTDDTAYTRNYLQVIDEIPVEEGVVIDHARIVCESLEDDDDKLSWFERNELSKSINVYVAVASETEE